MTSIPRREDHFQPIRDYMAELGVSNVTSADHDGLSALVPEAVLKEHILRCIRILTELLEAERRSRRPNAPK